MTLTVQGDLSKDIAAGIAVTSIIFAGSIYLPVLGIFCTLFIPLPILYYRSKLGRANGVIVPGVAVFIMLPDIPRKLRGGNRFSSIRRSPTI